MDQRERRVARVDVVDDHAQPAQVADLVERARLRAHLVPDAVDVFGPAADLGDDSLAREQAAQQLALFGDKGLALATLLLERARELAIRVRFLEAKREVLELPLQLPQTEAVGERCEHLKRLSCEPVFGRAPVRRVPPQDLHAGGQAHQHDADVDRHREHHPAQRLDLLGVGLSGKAQLQGAQLQQLAQAVDQFRDLGAESALDLVARDRVAGAGERGRDLRGIVSVQLAQDRDRRARLLEQRFAARRRCAPYSLGEQGERARDVFAVAFGLRRTLACALGARAAGSAFSARVQRRVASVKP